MRAGDYVLMQFAHNDQKEKGEGIGPYESYAEALTKMGRDIRAAGAHPVFVTSMYRRRFSGEEMYDTLGDYPVAMREAAQREEIPLLDLHAGSRVIFEALGAEGSKDAFLHFPAYTFPGQGEPLRDDTHFSTYGGNLLARYVVELVRAEVPELAAFVVEDLSAFDPASPPPFSAWKLSVSPSWK